MYLDFRSLTAPGLVTLQMPVLDLDVPTIQSHVLHLEMSTPQGTELHLEVSTQQRPVQRTWTCLDNRRL
jgi:hypothetical protein